MAADQVFSAAHNMSHQQVAILMARFMKPQIKILNSQLRQFSISNCSSEMSGFHSYQSTTPGDFTTKLPMPYISVSQTDLEHPKGNHSPWNNFIYFVVWWIVEVADHNAHGAVWARRLPK